jgi:hypothetical protein
MQYKYVVQIYIYTCSKNIKFFNNYYYYYYYYYLHHYWNALNLFTFTLYMQLITNGNFEVFIQVSVHRT